MNYGNNYYPYQYAYPQSYQQPQQQPASSGPIWVQGEAGAKSYLVAPNQTVTLWDTESQTIYVKSADQTGMPSMRVLDYTMRDPLPQNKQIQPESGYAMQSDVDYLKEQIIALRAKLDDMEGSKKK